MPNSSVINTYRSSQKTEAEKHLLSRFQLYEQSLPQIQQMLQYWDRTRGHVHRPVSTEEQTQESGEAHAQQAQTGKKVRKDREKETAEKEKHKHERLDSKLLSPLPSQGHLLPSDISSLENELAADSVPHICISVNQDEEPTMDDLVGKLKLPPLEEVLTHLSIVLMSF